LNLDESCPGLNCDSNLILGQRTRKLELVVEQRFLLLILLAPYITLLLPHVKMTVLNRKDGIRQDEDPSPTQP
jgi:hypothetical protein